MLRPTPFALLLAACASAGTPSADTDAPVAADTDRGVAVGDTDVADTT